MALEQPSPPGSVKNALLEGLREGGAPDEESLRYAHPLYYLPAGNLLADAPVQCKIAGWQFLATDPDGRAVAGEVSSAPEGEYETAIVRGSAVDEAFKASEQVQSLLLAQSSTLYQVRKLRIPAIRIEAVWLKAAPFDDAAGNSDLVYPYVTFHENLKRKVIGMSDFLIIARGLAAKEARADTSPRRGPNLPPTELA